ncbi:hypothetical protein NDU88_004115, partial [Pleurodeles waltl]
QRPLKVQHLEGHCQGADPGGQSVVQPAWQEAWEDLCCWSRKSAEVQLSQSSNKAMACTAPRLPLMAHILVMAYPEFDGQLRAQQQHQSGQRPLKVQHLEGHCQGADPGGQSVVQPAWQEAWEDLCCWSRKSSEVQLSQSSNKAMACTAP